mmetsp:Transcript_12333/g.13541  ORF Transcript_12333/g.13541 Transcript_12333/m.13541 type:complete len:82 (+) Transcript_12333:416-661(+)
MKEKKKKKEMNNSPRKRAVGFSVPRSIGGASDESEEDSSSHMSPAGKCLTKLIRKLAAKTKTKTAPKSKSLSKTNRKHPPE